MVSFVVIWYYSVSIQKTNMVDVLKYMVSNIDIWYQILIYGIKNQCSEIFFLQQVINQKEGH